MESDLATDIDDLPDTPPVTKKVHFSDSIVEDIDVDDDGQFEETQPNNSVVSYLQLSLVSGLILYIVLRPEVQSLINRRSLLEYVDNSVLVALIGAFVVFLSSQIMIHV